ncbi:MAG: histidine kinase [Bacteroidia bacterium]|nr:histidine kinase [Bacteroidia bacterium]
MTLIQLLIWQVEVYAQQFNYIQYTKDQGLAGNIAYSITQDHQGFIWIGTENGVSRYDGHSFTNFTTDDGLTDNEVLQVICDSKGRVWFHCFSSQLCFYEKGKIYNPTNSPHIFNNVDLKGMVEFHEDKRGIIWIRKTLSAYENGYAWFDGKSFHDLDFVSIALPVYQNNSRVLPVVSNGINLNGNYFLNSDGFLYEVDSNFSVNRIDSIQNISTKGISFIKNSSAINTCERLMYYYTNDVICLSEFLDGSRLKLTRIYRNTFDVNRLLFDEKTCTMWVVSNGEGVFAIDSSMNIISEVFLKNKNVGGILVDNASNYWFSTIGEGVFFLNSSLIKSYKLAQNDQIQKVYSFAFNSKGDLYVGYEKGILEKYHQQNLISSSNLSTMKLRSNVVKKILIKKDDTPVYVLENQIVFSDHTKKVKKTLNIGAIKDAGLLNDDKVVVVSRGAVLVESVTGFDTIINTTRYTSCSSGSSKLFYFSSIDTLFKFENKKILVEERHKVPIHGRIVDLWLAQDSSLWICTYNNGIRVLMNDTIVHFNSQNGLLSNQCRSLYYEGNGQMWVVTDKGLSKISINNRKPFAYKIQSLTINDGLPSEMIRQVLKRQDTLWIATDKGLAYFSEKQLKSRTEIPIYINSVLVNGVITDTSIFAYDENRITFNFSAISFSSGKQIRFRYFMKGLNDKWTETDQRTVEFGSLEPGNYTFIVLAIDKNGNESLKPASFTFSVSPPFWKRIGFQIVAINSGLLLLVIGIKGRIKRVAKNVHEKQLVNRQLAEFKLEAVRAQMNPHFIFNCLNAIQHFNVSHDFDSAQQYLSDFAFLIRKTLYLSKRDFISLEEEIEYLEAYLKLEKLRFEDHFSSAIEVDPQLNPSEVLVPSLLIQPFIENAINHGLKFLKNKNGELKVSFLKMNNAFEVIISDNGIGMEHARLFKESKHSTHFSQGMSLASGRIEVINKIYKSAISYVVEPLDPSNADHPGTKIIINIPLKPNLI